MFQNNTLQLEAEGTSVDQSLKHPIGMTYTPSGRTYPYLVPVITIFRSGRRNGTCFSSLLCSALSKAPSVSYREFQLDILTIVNDKNDFT